MNIQVIVNYIVTLSEFHGPPDKTWPLTGQPLHLLFTAFLNLCMTLQSLSDMWGVTPSDRWDWAGLRANIALHGENKLRWCQQTLSL